jgi:CRP-like cAMP-binding protein
MDTTARTGNLILDALIADERAALLADATSRSNPVGEERRLPGDAITMVFFPTRGTLSMIVDQDDDRVEAATVGREGIADVPASLGSRIASHTVLSQVEGDSIDVGVETFNKVYDEGPTFRTLVSAYIEAVFSQASISVACMALHHVNQRCARWLLETHDRVDSDTFFLKQEFLAMMLGVHRPSVSIAAGTLQASGAIAYQRGNITVVDREALEDAACSCYESMRSEYSRLVPLGG